MHGNREPRHLCSGPTSWRGRLEKRACIRTAVWAFPSPVRLASSAECAVPLTRDALCTTRVSMSVMGSGHSHTGTMELVVYTCEGEGRAMMRGGIGTHKVGIPRAVGFNWLQWGSVG